MLLRKLLLQGSKLRGAVAGGRQQGTAGATTIDDGGVRARVGGQPLCTGGAKQFEKWSEKRKQVRVLSSGADLPNRVDLTESETHNPNELDSRVNIMTKRSQFSWIKNNPNQTKDNPNQSDSSLSRRASSAALSCLLFLLFFLLPLLGFAFFDFFLGGCWSFSSSSSDSSSSSSEPLRFPLLFSSSSGSPSLSRARLPLRFFSLLLARFLARFAFF
jgi:hypothetical protein